MKIKDIKAISIPLILCSLLIFTTFALMINVLNENTIVDSNQNSNLNLKHSSIVNITLFEDDFESGLTKWSSITGLWHMTDSNSSSSNPYYSYEHGMWYGQNSTGDYDTSARTMGNLTSDSFDLSSVYQANLEFYEWRGGESGRDPSYVYIYDAGEMLNKIYENTIDIPTWERKAINISMYSGNSSVIIRFYFDTADDVNNAFEGWLVDDVKVTGLEVDSISPVITASPSNFSSEYGYTGQSLSWTATDTHPDTYTIELQGTGIVAGPTAWINNTAVTFNIPDGFALGNYVYIINFTDKGNNYITDNVTFTVEDNTSPTITNAPSNFSVDFGYTGQSLSWTATDPHPYNYTIELQGTGIVAGPTNWSSGEAITYNITDGFALGNYEYMINLTDDQGNFITDNATFTVEDPTPPNIIDAPSDFVVEYGYTGQSLSWTATDNHPINYTIELQGTGLVAGPAPWISGNAITYNILNGYAVGDYIYIVNFTDDKGNYTTDSVTFSVQDATDPIITVAPSDLTLAYDYTGESLSWTATDPHPNTYIIELQGTGIVVPTTWISGNAITYNIPDGLAPGVYVYNITLTDLYGNSFSDLVSVTVEEKPASTDNIPFGNFYLIFIAIGIITLIIKIKRKK